MSFENLGNNILSSGLFLRPFFILCRGRRGTRLGNQHPICLAADGKLGMMRCRARSPGAQGLCPHSTLLGDICFLSTLVLAACLLPSTWAVAGSKSFLKGYYKNVYTSSELVQDRTAFWGWFFSFILFYTFRGNQKKGTSYTPHTKKCLVPYLETPAQGKPFEAA